MDIKLKLSKETDTVAMPEIAPRSLAAPMPPETPLAMPRQKLGVRPGCVREPPRPNGVTRLARLIAFGGAVLLTLYGAFEVQQVIAAGSITVLEGIMAVLFTINFAWISFSASSAVAGMFVRSADVAPIQPNRPLTSKTALVMPIYNEDALQTTAALQAMGEALLESGVDRQIEIVLLSDSNDPNAWVRETIAFNRLRNALHPNIPVWYRRRWRNHGRKAGNVEDFVTRWGGRYDFMIVLDADSLMSAETIIALAHAMEDDSSLGILQTVPVVAGGTSFFARLQQFAGRTYGPVVSRAIAAWQGDDGNYWGHNAIIRTRAFAEACGLPVLPGQKPLGGEIMSHDFVEAALMRRAGWSVRMAPKLGGSWEACPPSLLDVAIRDRRWAQGNLQHAKIVGAKGLAWPNRVHFMIGIMSYASSVFWLSLLAVGIALTLQAQLVRPEYFPETVQLFPTWPHFDSERMLRLFVVSMGILFLPKLIGLIGLLADRQLRRGAGGPIGAVFSVGLEIILSALYAPVMMLLQCRQLYEILSGKDSGWATQRRQGGTAWHDAWRHHHWHAAVGILIGVAAWLISPMILAWLSPIVVGLLLATPLSKLSGSERAGRLLRRLSLLRIVEDVNPPWVERRRDELVAQSTPLPQDGLLALVQSAATRELHVAGLLPKPPDPRGVPNASRLSAAAKIAEAESRDEALSWLDRAERLQVLAHPDLLNRLAELPHLTSHPVPELVNDHRATG